MWGWVMGYWSPGGAVHAPVFGSHIRLHARGCTAHTGGSVRKPPTVGPAGVCMTYGGDGGGVGSAPAVGAVTTMAATDAMASRVFLIVFMLVATFPIQTPPDWRVLHWTAVDART